MPSTEPVELHLPYEILLGDGTSMTLAMLCPAAWYARLYMGAAVGMRWRASSIGSRRSDDSTD